MDKRERIFHFARWVRIRSSSPFYLLFPTHVLTESVIRTVFIKHVSFNAFLDVWIFLGGSDLNISKDSFVFFSCFMSDSALEAYVGDRYW